ncbi:hypothetical protein O0555_21340 [Brevibacillus laterosporus]|uniref:phage tail assembly chaperone n=1 Tax=Brevibacillus laterosporus TaxID=1465 RepID=UPI00215BD3C2|nr:hypothetical protein [Brevibacillus laterosporus]MCR8939848.1 hypothetical protein [Brevibacillus laterosporus]MCZ0842488.1 hypothetical protein [Brevibacillus laterosporus]MCZ0847784.1 hypothetical protein [Brevibacillus laterosporus]
MIDDLLKALLDADKKPEKDVQMKRFGTFRIRALDDQEIEDIEERATFGKSVDQTKKALLMIQKATIVPDWSHPDLLAKYETQDSVRVVEKTLLPGERVKLFTEILELSGYDLGAAVDQVKN